MSPQRVDGVLSPGPFSRVFFKFGGSFQGSLKGFFKGFFFAVPANVL